MYGEGNWKADEEYREGVKQFSKTHDSERLARRAARELEPDLRKSDDPDESARRGREEEPEW